MTASIFGIFLAIVVGLASAQQQQCTAPEVIQSPDMIANYSLTNLFLGRTFKYKFDSNGSPTTLALSICSPYTCDSQCAVQTIANNGATTCYGNCTNSATIMGLNNYNGLIVNYTAGGNSAQATLRCNPRLDSSDVIIHQVTLNGAILSVVGETHCRSTPKPYTMTQTFYGSGWPCANDNVLGGSAAYVSHCKSACTGSRASSTYTECVSNYQ